MTQAATVRAAELQILAGGGIAAPLKELAAQFEAASGHKLVIRFGTTPELIKMATTGGPFDAAVVPVDVMKDAAALAKLVPGAQTAIARVGLGVAVRSGAPKPDISTPDALKKTLLNAKSIASIPASATGYLLARVYEKLGITEEMKARTKPRPTPAQIVESVAKGETELGVFLTNVLTAPGLDVVGPFPPELQLEVVYTGAVAASAREAEAAKAFLQFITTPAAAAVIKAKGMTPG
jgi:molybdate transport system substrate-binding protein